MLGEFLPESFVNQCRFRGCDPRLCSALLSSFACLGGGEGKAKVRCRWTSACSNKLFSKRARRKQVHFLPLFPPIITKRLIKLVLVKGKFAYLSSLQTPLSAGDVRSMIPSYLTYLAYRYINQALTRTVTILRLGTHVSRHLC